MHDYRRCPMDGALLRRVERVWDEPTTYVHLDGTAHLDRSANLRWSPGPSSILELAKAASPYTVSADKLEAAGLGRYDLPYRWGGRIATAAHFLPDLYRALELAARADYPGLVPPLDATGWLDADMAATKRELWERFVEYEDGPGEDTPPPFPITGTS